MAKNFHIKSGVRSEQLLYENLVIESLKIYGQEVYYLPRDIVNENKIFGDDVPSRFNSSYKIEMFIENVEGFQYECSYAHVTLSTLTPTFKKNY